MWCSDRAFGMAWGLPWDAHWMPILMGHILRLTMDHSPGDVQMGVSGTQRPRQTVESALWKGSCQLQVESHFPLATHPDCIVPLSGQGMEWFRYASIYVNGQPCHGWMGLLAAHSGGGAPGYPEAAPLEWSASDHSRITTSCCRLIPLTVTLPGRLCLLVFWYFLSLTMFQQSIVNQSGRFARVLLWVSVI